MGTLLVGPFWRLAESMVVVVGAAALPDEAVSRGDLAPGRYRSRYCNLRPLNSTASGSDRVEPVSGTASNDRATARRHAIHILTRTRRRSQSWSSAFTRE